MATRNIVHDDDEDAEILKKQSKEVKTFDENLWQLLDDMWDTMYENDGVGLAAVQVGVLKRVIIADINEMRLECVNPKLTFEEGQTCEKEGCLSVTGKSGYVNRPYKVTVEAQDRTGMPFTITVVKDMARCLCHEIDHTKGILFTEKIAPSPVENEKNNEDKKWKLFF